MTYLKGVVAVKPFYVDIKGEIDVFGKHLVVVVLFSINC